jgi:hypothetical protein
MLDSGHVVALIAGGTSGIGLSTTMVLVNVKPGEYGSPRYPDTESWRGSAKFRG